MVFSQLCGQQALLFYGILQFESLGFTGQFNGLRMNIISSAIQLCSCLISWFLTDRLGRKKLFAGALGAIIFAYVLSGALTDAYPNNVNMGVNIVCVICIYIIQCSYAGVLGALQWVYVSTVHTLSFSTMKEGYINDEKNGDLVR